MRGDNAAVHAFYRHPGYGLDDVAGFGKRLVPDLADAPPAGLADAAGRQGG